MIKYWKQARVHKTYQVHRAVKQKQYYYWLVTNLITNCYWLHYKLDYKLLLTCYKLDYKLLLTSLPAITDLLQTWLQIITNFITNYYWLHYKLLLTYYKLGYNLLLTSMIFVNTVHTFSNSGLTKKNYEYQEQGHYFSYSRQGRLFGCVVPGNHEAWK